MRSTLLQNFRLFSQNRGALIGLLFILFFTLLALLAPWLAPKDPNTLYVEHLRETPFHPSFLLGTDDLGRDYLSRLIYGARISLGTGILIVLFSGTVGTILGLLGGFYGKKIDWAVMRLVDILMAFPSILLAMAVVSILGPGLLNAIIAVSIVACPQFIKIARAKAMIEKKQTYIMASRTFGASSPRLIFKEILPNCLGPLLVQASLGVSDGILNVAALGFLGLGAQAPTPEWGIMLADARVFIMSSPFLVTLPGICILILVLSFNLFGDGLRDIIDPKLKARSS